MQRPRRLTFLQALAAMNIHPEEETISDNAVDEDSEVIPIVLENEHAEDGAVMEYVDNEGDVEVSEMCFILTKQHFYS